MRFIKNEKKPDEMSIENKLCQIPTRTSHDVIDEIQNFSIVMLGKK